MTDLDQVGQAVVTAVLLKHFKDSAPRVIRLFLWPVPPVDDVNWCFLVRSEFGEVVARGASSARNDARLTKGIVRLISHVMEEEGMNG